MDPKYYTYYPTYFSEVPFQEVLDELQPFFGDNVVYNTLIERKSCKFSIDPDNPQLISYNNRNTYHFSASPWIEYFRQEIQDLTGVKYDYVLVHLYPTGTASISSHNDKEALNSSVASISLGTTRRMKFRPLGTTKGCLQTFNLAHGDVLIMENGCQRHYQHEIPKERKITEPRINLTWRVFQ